jgi:hypothetical protein
MPSFNFRSFFLGDDEPKGDPSLGSTWYAQQLEQERKARGRRENEQMRAALKSLVAPITNPIGRLIEERRAGREGWTEAQIRAEVNRSLSTQMLAPGQAVSRQNLVGWRSREAEIESANLGDGWDLADDVELRQQIDAKGRDRLDGVDYIAESGARGTFGKGFQQTLRIIAEQDAAAAAARNAELEAQKAIEKEANRQKIETQQRVRRKWQGLKNRILAPKRVEQFVTGLQAAVETKWRNFLEAEKLRHEELDNIVTATRCWRCGQLGRLPVDQLTELGAPNPPVRNGATISALIEKADLQFHARRHRITLWKFHNDKRLEVERLRIDANYHPALAVRFTISRTCEICRSEGIFHAEHINGDGRAASLQDRWQAHFGQLYAMFKNFWGSISFVPVPELSENQAKEWVKNPKTNKLFQPQYVEYLAFVEKRNNRELTIRKGFYYDSQGRMVVEPRISPTMANGVDVSWPNPNYWLAGHYPDKWKGGVNSDLEIKPGLQYSEKYQDPLHRALHPRA